MIKEKSKLSIEEWNEYFSGHWNFPGEKQDNHLAIFPEELPRRLIKMFSFVGETVLDPFLGSGTTTLAAQNLNRSSIGYEINESFLPFIKEKLRIKEPNMFNKTIVEFVKPKRQEIDYRRQLQELPYIFHDPVQFNKKIDPRKMPFGSKIDLSGNGNEKRDFLRVRQVISPKEIELSNGLIVRLIGIKEVAEKEGEAIEWLWDKLRGESVYLKFDEIKYDENNRLLSYLYLKNKTFINLHFLRTNLVQLDKTFPFRYLEKFEAIIPGQSKR
jgi:site-specific DNA-methyltransferase (adenine-specific)